ncbi:MAG: hypothetical protein WCG80_16575 [Spirochaetales bacterium]
MRRFAPFLFVLTLGLASCGPSRPTYTDRVQDLPAESADARLLELAHLLSGKNFAESTKLAEVWKQWLVSIQVGVPLQEGNNFTFVYYDAGDQLDAVWLQASFCPSAPLPMERWQNSRLFYRSFIILKPALLHYHFVSSGTNPDSYLADPFHPDVAPGDNAESTFPKLADPRIHAIDAALEPGLAGQNLRILLPPGYDRDLSHTWPLIVLVGRTGTHWDEVITPAFDNGTVLPNIVVALIPDPSRPLTAASLALKWSQELQPWLASHYRITLGPAGTFLLGWGEESKAALEAAAAHPDFFGHAWAPPAGTNTNDLNVWNQNIAQVLRTYFLKVAP